MASGFHPAGQSVELSTTTYTIAPGPTTQPHIPTSNSNIHMSQREPESPRDAASEATTAPTVTGDATTSTTDDGPTQRSLQQASLALELALSRIVEVRRSLLQLAQSMPRGTPSDASQDSDEPDLNLRASAGVGPAHDAILLAGDAPPGGGQWGAGRQRRRHHPNARVWDSIPDAIEPTYSPSPASDAAARLAQRYDEMYAALMSADPAATTRGLRVAAREAHAGAQPREAAAPGADFVLTQEYDEIRGVMSLGLRPPPPPPPAPLPRAPLPPAWRANDPRRWRARGGPMPLAPLPAPPAGAGAGASAEAPPRLPSFADFIGATPPIPGSGPFPEGGGAARFAERYRLYQEARNAGDDDAALDWADDDFYAWLFPAPRAPPLPAHLMGSAVSPPGAAGGNAVRVTRTTETQVSPADRPAGPARRRGWARLDPDGNEVPPDEEREIERARTEHRMRSAHPRRLPVMTSYGGVRGLHQFFGPAAPDASRAAQPVADTGPEYDDAAAAVVAALPMYVDPLPMPLAAMVADAQRPAGGGGDDARKAVAVPPHACLAGR